MLFTLKNFIDDCGFLGIRALTCTDSLESPVTGVNVIDNPDVAQWVRPGEMVLTTGYFFSSDPLLQTNVIMNLKAAGCSALGIKLKRFFPELPQNLLKTAEKAGLPILDIPSEYAFSEITQKIHDALNGEKLQNIRREQLLFNALIGIFRSEQSLDSSLKLLSDFLSASLFIVDGRLSLISFYLCAKDRPWISGDGSLSILPEGNQKLLPQSSEEVYAWLRVGEGKFYGALVPFPDTDLYLCLPGDVFLASPDTVLRSMKLFRFPKERPARLPGGISEYYGDFFHLLLSDSPKPSDVDNICRYYGYPQAGAQLCILFALRTPEKTLRLQAPVGFLKECLRSLSVPASDFFIASYGRQICLFLLSNQGDCSRTAAACAKAFQEEYKTAFAAGISQMIPGRQNIIPAYRQAAFLVSLADIFPEQKYFLFHDYLLFWNIKDLSEEERRKILEDTVKPLVDYDAKNNADLFLTLLQYFRSQFNASLAAKDLYIHRNTLLKRLAKISELILFDPGNINNLFSLYYGICVYLMESH